jgi:heme A synthase
MLHAHVTSWILTLILFVVAYSLYKAGKNKGAKITHMSLRLFLLLTAGTGIGMVFQYSNIIYTPLLIKAALSLWLLFLMEIILVRTSKGTLDNMYWIRFAIVLIVVLYLGLEVLPLSFLG